MRWTAGNVLLALCLVAASVESRHITGDPRALRKIMGDNQGIIEWIIQHVEDAIRDLEKQSTVDGYQCLVGMSLVAQGIAQGNLWAISMVDSSGKIPNGLLQANFRDFGAYDECLATANPGHDTPFTGMHCLVDFKLTVPEDMTFVIDGTPMKISTLLGSNVVTLTLGQCYPSICKPLVIQEAYNSLTGKVANMTKGSYKLDVVISPNDCNIADSDLLPTSEWLVIMVIGLVLFLTALSTTLDVAFFRHELKNRRPTPGEQAAISFSAYTNGMKLLSLKQGPESINSLNGLKFLSICWVVLAHRYRYVIDEPITNLVDVAPAIKQWSKMLLMSGPLAVDTFFVISGLLNMYMFMRARSKSKRFTIGDVLVSYVHRYFRLTPSYAMAVAFTATLLYRLGNGPEWDRLVSPVRDSCQRGWWYNMAYVNNYGGVELCMMQSWYLSADMQLFWVAPLLVYPLWRWPIVGYIEVFILICLSVVSPAYTSWYYKISSPIPIVANGDMINTVMRRIYLPTHVKFSSYVVGIFLGYMVYQIRTKKWKLKINKITASLLWLVSAGLMLYSVFGGYQCFQLDYVYNEYFSAFYIGFYRLFWALGLSWIILACDNGWAGPINGFLSWEIFGPLGKLTYCIYLVHISVMLLGEGAVRSTFYYSDYSQVHKFFGDLVLCIVVAAAFSLLFEAPLMIIEKLLFNPQRATKKKPAVEKLKEEDPVIPSGSVGGSSELMRRHPRTVESTNL